MAETNAYFITPPIHQGASEPLNSNAYFAPALFTPDYNPPVATLISPASLVTPIAPSTPVVVDVEDDRGLTRVTAWVEYPNGASEVMFARGVFSSKYAGSTFLELIAGIKWRFTFRCNGGWSGVPYVWIEGVDIAGNVSQ